MKNKILIFIVSLIANLLVVIFFVYHEPTKKETTYLGILKEPCPKIFDTDSMKGYIVPFMLKDSLGKIVVIDSFVIIGSAKEVQEMYRFVKDNIGQKCFVTTEETTINAYQRITEIVMK